MAWEWPRQGLLVQGLFNSKWYDGQIRRCHYKEKDGLQTAEVYEVEVQWDGECSQSRLPVEQVRLRPSHRRFHLTLSRPRAWLANGMRDEPGTWSSQCAEMGQGEELRPREQGTPGPHAATTQRAQSTEGRAS